MFSRLPQWLGYRPFALRSDNADAMAPRPSVILQRSETSNRVNRVEYAAYVARPVNAHKLSEWRRAVRWDEALCRPSFRLIGPHHLPGRKYRHLGYYHR